MTVTRVEPLTKTKFRIYIDEHPAFVLYQGEVKRTIDLELQIARMVSFGREPGDNRRHISEDPE